MESDLIYGNVATELLEIFKYLEIAIKEKIPVDLEQKLIELRNESYVFKIDKTKSLNDQNILPETRQILSMIYLKYCCSEEESADILNKKKSKDLEIENIKREKYSVDNIFNSEKNVEIQEEPTNMEMIVYNETTSIYQKIIHKIKSFWEKIVRK